MLLAIDTSTRVISIAVATPASLLAEHTWQGHNQHTQQLTPALQSLLAGAGLRMSDLTAVAVAQGPGSFTGLRIGIAIAKGIALAKGLPMYAVPSHQIIAAATPIISDKTLIAVLPAGRGRVLAAWYMPDTTAQKWVTAQDVTLLEWPKLVQQIDNGSVILNGEISDVGLQSISEANADSALLPLGLRVRRAGFLAQIAPEYPPQSPDLVFPLYVKSP